MSRPQELPTNIFSFCGHKAAEPFAHTDPEHAGEYHRKCNKDDRGHIPPYRHKTPMDHNFLKERIYCHDRNHAFPE